MPSQKQFIQPLRYFSDSAKLFSAMAGKQWAVFLDSGYPHCQQGRYDILACDPVCTLVTRGDSTEIMRDGIAITSSANPFDLVKQQLLPALSDANDLPFNGGAIGYFSYDLARRLEKLPVSSDDAEHIPEMAVGIYQWAVIVDHHRQQSYLTGYFDDEQTMRALASQFSQLQEAPCFEVFSVLSAIQCNMDSDAYRQAFDRIKLYLQEGDCYQVNLAQRFVANCSGDPWSAYQALRELNAAPFSCYLNFQDVQILSSSPERFLKLMNGIVETKPIKGTRPRKQDVAEDRMQIRLLETSEKDRAENLMIVDLLRNDIGKTCKKGSVKVSKLFAVETYSTVHHLVSTVTGELEADQHALDLLKSCFPGGSITGAPKVRAMEIIEELEPNRRGVYCGAIGYIGFDGNMDTNVAIRTLVHSNETIRFWAGGGIVHDSSVEDEYQECFDKASAMLDLLRSMSVK
ncbi:MAG: aminodeoxychorismate synthase component I [Methylococcaceae bacterium]|nr:aminodeoxychorismate synthase component I [Methylococcaceae bacterium]